MRLISWNTNARRQVEQQSRALLSRLPDMVALQEATAGSVTAWAEALRAGGLQHLRATSDESSATRRGPHAYGVLIASRHPFVDSTSVSFSVRGWDEKALTVCLDTPVGEMALHNVHVPNGSADKPAKYAFDDGCLDRLNLSLTRRDSCAGDRPHDPVAVRQSAAGLSRFDSSPETPTRLVCQRPAVSQSFIAGPGTD